MKFDGIWPEGVLDADSFGNFDGRNGDGREREKEQRQEKDGSCKTLSAKTWK